MTPMRRAGLLVICCLAVAACGGGGRDESVPATVDPGQEEWQLVPPERVAEECKLDPELLRRADAVLDRPWAIVRYGKLCHEYYPDGADAVTEVYSATKTLGAVVTGIAAYETRDLPRRGRKTGPLSDGDRVDHWLDAFSFNPDALVAHVLAMVAHNPDLGIGAKQFVYDTVGSVQINRLSDIINTAIDQDPARFGADLEEFTQRFLFAPLGMRDSVWSSGLPDKVFAFTWRSTVRDMARLGLLILNKGVWNGRRILSEDWIYRMTHPAFEDANTSYAYLTWLAARSNYGFGGAGVGDVTFDNPLDPCSPAALWNSYPHEFSNTPDCNYDPPWTCDQDYDVGVWLANGAGGQLIVGHPGLDLVLVVKDLGGAAFHGTLWGPVRPAVIALDPVYQGDEAAFCSAYGNNAYAPDLRR
jgi:hypothetical protein